MNHTSLQRRLSKLKAMQELGFSHEAENAKALEQKLKEEYQQVDGIEIHTPEDRSLLAAICYNLNVTYYDKQDFVYATPENALLAATFFFRARKHRERLLFNFWNTLAWIFTGCSNRFTSNFRYSYAFAMHQQLTNIKSEKHKVRQTTLYRESKASLSATVKRINMKLPGAAEGWRALGDFPLVNSCFTSIYNLL